MFFVLVCFSSLPLLTFFTPDCICRSRGPFALASLVNIRCFTQFICVHNLFKDAGDDKVFKILIRIDPDRTELYEEFVP